MADNQLDVASIPQTAIKVLTSPAAFFREMPKTGGFVAPLIFMVLFGFLAGVVQAVLSLLHLSAAHGVFMSVAIVFLAPILVGIFGFVGAAIAWVIWKVLGSSESYETAYRCVAYMSVLAPIRVALNVIPYAGMIASAALGTVFIVIASVEVHRIAKQKAAVVFGVIATVLVLMGISAQLAARRMSEGLAGFQQQIQAQGGLNQQQVQALQKFAEAQKQMAAQMQNAAAQRNAAQQNAAPQSQPASR